MMPSWIGGTERILTDRGAGLASDLAPANLCQWLLEQWSRFMPILMMKRS
jgi:hypothetical protein